MTALLFIIALFYGLIFSTAQDAMRFLSPEMNVLIAPCAGLLTLPLYFSGVGAALVSQLASRLMGIKNVLIAGLCANFVGMAFFYATHFFRAGSTISYAFLIIGLLSLGVAISWGATVLATYMIVKFPKRIALGLILVYSCLDFGFMFSQPIFSFFLAKGAQSIYLLSLALLTVVFIFTLRSCFTDPLIPKNIEPLRKGTFLWKKLHYRIPLFIFAMVLYGVLESTFSFFGRGHLEMIMSHTQADQIIFVFWMTLALAQITIGVPSFWVSPGKVLYILPLFAVLALVLGLFQSDYSGYLLTFIIGALGCSAIFPLLIAMVGVELGHMGEEEILPYFESGVGYLVAAYMLGLGIVGLIANRQDRLSSQVFEVDFKAGIACALALLMLCIFLDVSQPLRKKH